MSDEKPLHVRVAEALGWQRAGPCSIYGDDPGQCYGSGVMRGQIGCAKEYDTDWAATGPLIERLKLALRPSPNGPAPWLAELPPERFWSDITPPTLGSTPLVAVCELVLALNAAGKLPT